MTVTVPGHLERKRNGIRKNGDGHDHDTKTLASLCTFLYFFLFFQGLNSISFFNNIVKLSIFSILLSVVDLS